MVEKERRLLISNKIKQNGYVSVQELIQEMNVSRSSVMRDLIVLENEGVLIREHGGAVFPLLKKTLSKKFEKPILKKDIQNAEAKKNICREAAKLLRDGRCVFVDSGTTMAYLLPFLLNYELIIVTPSIFLVRKLPETYKCKIFVIGGQYDTKYDMVLGAYSTQLIQQFNFDITFMSTNGIDLDSGSVTSADYENGALKKVAMERSKMNCLLADSTKLNQTGIHTWAKISDFSRVFVDAGSDKADLPNNFVICDEYLQGDISAEIPLNEKNEFE
ncbi:DeoR/GlpR family DNA-binding transcription regulator [Hungatella hathewayi]|uniref:DeoR/GlpR family DNA-binding transcription regulator n=1 Tax=Hungatella hathewayi TaxID=154046 RepID=UPI001C019665|nr:DeoR/GlpR family DNA-binding transcription regulator [Hungatella hathewayi]MBT9795134.1 DeoR family transcriptional regulator [Hungatella hathewayi]